MPSRFEAIAGTAIGYTAGTGASVEQANNKTTEVTINAPSGEIVTDDADLATTARATFKVNNSFMRAHDCVIVNHASEGTGNAYLVYAQNFEEGAFHITLENITSGTLGEEIKLSFAIIKAANS